MSLDILHIRKNIYIKKSTLKNGLRLVVLLLSIIYESLENNLLNHLKIT